MVTVAVDVAITGWFTSAIIGKLINKASSYFKGQKSWQSGMKAELDCLSKFRPQIEALVYVAERGDLRGDRNPALVEWLGQLRDAIEEADNVLDELEYRHLKEEADEGRGKWAKTVVKFAVRATQQDDVLKRLKEVVKTFDNLVAGLGTFAQVLSWLDGRTATEVRGDILGRETSRMFTENELFGREKEKQTIIRWLNNSETKIISVFSIVGVGGVGKTALAQNLFDHPGLDFQIKMWACVSTYFEVKAIIMKILESLTKTKHEFATLDAAQCTLKEKIAGKKFLLVLDDAWNDEEREKWNKVMAPLKYGFAGSKILLTTRMESVANIVAKVVNETKMSLNLNGLEEKDNVLLFEQYAFAGFDPNEYARLRSIGNKIASKVKGIPLAVKAVGGMLNNKLEAEYWNRVLEDGALNWDKETDGIMAAIRLSYEHLPPELKPCFKYCSIFPEDFRIEREKLMEMWISVGLIPEGEKSQEELASEFFETLVRKSFLEPKTNYFYSNEEELASETLVRRSFLEPKAKYYYSMHDLLHELAQILSKNECLRVVSNDSIHIPQSIRHLSLRTSNILVLKHLPKLKYLRTLLLFCDIGDDIEDAELVDVIDTALEGMKTIRYLLLSSYHLCDFPKSIGDLIHLRFLSIQRAKIKKLSPCVFKLYHLQILKFSWNHTFDGSELSIPADICKLSKLKRLYLPSDATSDAISTIPHIGKLRSLEKLIGYSVKGEAGFDISELEMMSELRELKLITLKNVKSTEAASKAQLSSKQHLRLITLEWGHGFGVYANIERRNAFRNDSDKEVADCLQPHPNLIDLSLKGYRALNPPNWLKPQFLPNLTTINLAHCHSLERLPPFGQLPYLKSLSLQYMRALKEIGLEFFGSSESGNTFPALELLKLNHLIHLVEWREGTQSKNWFPCLKRLEVHECPSLTKLPPIPTTLKELRILPGFKQKNERNSTNEGLFLLSLPQLLQDLSLLSFLELENCADLLSLPSANVLQSLTSLKKLLIKNCERLKSLGGLEAIPSLKVLVIRKCPMLATNSSLVPIEELPRNRLSMALVSLVVDEPDLLLVVPLRNLHLTKSLAIWGGLSTMLLLLDQWFVQNGAFLQSLYLDGVAEVHFILDIVEKLPCLRVLELHHVYYLMRLPALPRSLEILRIWWCSKELAGRLEKGGLDYDKIRNLNVSVSGVKSQLEISQLFS